MRSSRFKSCVSFIQQLSDGICPFRGRMARLGVHFKYLGQYLKYKYLRMILLGFNIWEKHERRASLKKSVPLSWQCVLGVLYVIEALNRKHKSSKALFSHWFSSSFSDEGDIFPCKFVTLRYYPKIKLITRLVSESFLAFEHLGCFNHTHDFWMGFGFFGLKC